MSNFQKRVLDLAAKGVGLVSPNPLVGCVIVSESGEIVGGGLYTYDGVIHAEVVALNQAGNRAKGRNGLCFARTARASGQNTAVHGCID